MDYFGKDEIQVLPKSANVFHPIFRQADSTSFNVLITRFEDYKNKENTYCIGRSIQESIGIIDANKTRSSAIVAEYADSISPPKSTRQAEAIQRNHNADLIIYGRAQNFSNCDSANVCFRYNIEETLIPTSKPVFDINLSKHDAKYVLTTPFEIEKGNFQIEELTIRKWISLLAELKISNKDISFSNLENIMIDSDILPNEKLAEIYVNIGKTCTSLNQYQCSIEAYAKAIDLYPDKAVHYNRRGIAYKNAKIYDKAILDYNQAIQLDSNYADAYYNRGAVYERIKKYDSSISNFKKAIELKSTDEDYFIYLGFIYDKKGDYQKEIENLNKAISLNPKDTLAYFNRGVSYGHLGNKEKALLDLDKALSLDSISHDAYNSRGIVFKNFGNFAQALKDYNKAIDLAKNEHTYAYYNKGNLYVLMEEWDLAIENLNTAISLNPNDPDIYYLRGRAKVKLDNFKSSIEDFNKCIELEKVSPQIYYFRGIAYYQLQDYKKAISDLDKAISLDSVKAGLYFHRARAHYKGNNKEIALKDFNKAIDLDSKYTNAYNSRGVLYLKSYDFDKAILDFQKTISLDPYYTYGYTNLFFAYCLKYWYLTLVLLLITLGIFSRKRLINKLKKSNHS